MSVRPKGITGSGGVVTTQLDEILATLSQVKQSIADTNKQKIDPPVNTDRLKELNDEITHVRENISKQSRTNDELFNTNAIQKNIGKATALLDSFFDKIQNQGKKLTGNETKAFIDSFKTLEAYGMRFSKDLTSKYQSIFSDMFQSVQNKEYEIAHVVGSFDYDDFKQELERIKAELSNQLGEFQYSLRDAQTEAVENAVKQQTSALKAEKKQIQDTNNTFIQAEREKKAAIRATRDEIINSLKERVNGFVDNIGDNQFLDIDESKVNTLQTMVGDLLQLMGELGLETKDISELFERLSSKIYVPHDVIDSKVNQELEIAKSRIQELEQEIEKLKTEMSSMYSDGDIESVYNQHADHILQYEHEISELKTLVDDLESELRNSVNWFDWSDKCETVENLTRAVEELQKKVHDLSIDNEILEDENRDLQSNATSTEIRNSASAIKEEGDAAENATKQKLAFVNANQEVAQSGINTVNSIIGASSSIDHGIEQAFELDPITTFIQLLSQISTYLNDIKTTLGTVDSNNGFKNIIQNVDTLLQKLDEVYAKIGTGNYHVTVNQGIDKTAQKSNEAIKEYTRKTSARYQGAYDKLVQSAGNEELLFSYMNNILNAPGGVTELTNLYSSISVSKLRTSEEKVYRMISFFKLLRQAATDENFGLDISGVTIPKGSDATFRAKIRELSGLKKGQQEEVLANIGDEGDSLNKVINKLNEIKEILSDISQKDLFGNSLQDVATQLSEISSQLENLFNNSQLLNQSFQQEQQQVESTAQAELQLADSMEKVDQERADDQTNQITEESARLTTEEAQAMQQLFEMAIKAAEAKKEFAGANKEVLESILASLSAINSEGDGFKQLNNILNKLSKNDKMKDVISNLRKVKNILNTDVGDNAFVNAIRDILKEGDKLKDLATVLKATVTQINKAKTAIGNNINSNTNNQSAEDNQIVLKAIAAQKRIGKLQSDLIKYQNDPYLSQNEELINKTKERISSYRELVDAAENVAKTSEQIAAMEDAEAESALKVAKANAEVASSEQKAEESKEKQNASINKMRSSLLKTASALMENGKLMKNYGTQVHALYNEINNTSTTEERLKQIQIELNKITAQAKAAGQSGKTMTQMIGNRLKSLLTYLSSFASFYRIVSFVRTSISTIKDLDTQLVDLRKTTTMNNTELERFYENSSSIARKLGVTTSEILSQAAAWSRLGYSTEEAATKMAQLSSKFTSISPGMTTDNATDYLVSTMQAYGIAVDDVERKILDNVNRIGNTFATTNAEIGEMLTRSSAAMKAANNSLEETIALESAAVEITRNAETTGTAFRTVSMRIRGLDEETEDALEDYEELKGKIADLTKTASTPGGISLFTDESKTEFKSTYQFLKDIAAIWDQLTDKAQANLLETIAGKRGAQALSGILSDFSEVDRAMKEMENAAGSADKEMGVIRDSIDYKLNAIKQEWTGTLQDVLKRDDLKDLLDFILKISEGLGSVVSYLGLAKTAIIGISAVIGSKKLGLFQYKNGQGIRLGESGLGGLVQSHGQNKIDRQGYKAVISAMQNNNDLNLRNLTLDNNASVGFAVGMSDKEITRIRAISQEYESHEKQLEALQENYKKFGNSVTKVGGVLKSFATNILNGLVTSAIVALGTQIVSQVITAFDRWIMTEEEAAKLAEKFRGSYETLRKESTDTAKQMSEIEDEFAMLSKGVNALGENVNLTSEQFDRYHEITSIIAEKNPDLVQGYDEQGRAIIRLTSNLDSLTEAYERYQQKQASKLYNEVDDDNDRIIVGTLKNAGKYLDDTVDFDSNEYKTVSAQDRIDLYEKLASATHDELEEIIKTNGSGLAKEILDDAGATANMTEDAYRVASERLRTAATNWENSVKDAASDVGDAGITYAESVREFWDLTSEQQKYIRTALENLDSDTIRELNLTDIDKLEAFINRIFQSIKASGLDSEQIDIRMNLMTQLNSGEISVREYLEKVEELNQWLESIPDDDTRKVVSILFKVSEESEKGINDGIERLKQLLGENYSDEVLDYFTPEELERVVSNVPMPDFDLLNKELSITEEKLAKLKEEHKEDTEEAKKYEDRIIEIRKELARFKPAGKTSGNGIFDGAFNAVVNLTWNPYQVADVKEKVQSEISPIEAEVNVKASDAIDAMAETKTAITSVADLWEQTVQERLAMGKDKKYLNTDDSVSKEGNTSNMAVGFADPALINSIEEAFKKLETVDADGNKIIDLGASLEEFEKTMIEVPNDADAAQKAIDKLITAYIDQTSIIHKLTEENKEWSIAQLEAYGVTNAQAVVESRLDKQNKKLLDSTKKLSKYFDEFGAKLESNDPTEYGQALLNLRNTMKEVFTYEGDEQTLIPDFDDEFLLKNLDLIKQAAAGDVDALNALRVEAGKDIVAKMEIKGIDSEEINRLRELIGNGLTEIQKYMDDNQLEAGAKLNDAPMIDGLNNLVKAGQITRDEMNAALASIGVVPDPNAGYEDVDIKTANLKSLTDAYGLSGSAAAAVQQSMSTVAKVRVPKIAYKVGKITGASYSKPSTGGSTGGSSGGSNGSNSGSDNKLQEDTKETFDWIEVKIQRLDEAIARLDKTVGNTYKTWGKRNKALGEELEKVAEEVKVHEHAQKRYLANAKALKISDVNKKPKKSDYSDNKEQYEYDLGQYNQAVKDWKTGKYQKLVREGKIGKDDIQYIENKYLADAIKQYTEIYNKAVQAGDAIEDDKIKLGDLNKTKFDNIKSEYEGLISLIEDANNLVEERINNTQERGYFVNKKYYQQEIKNVKEERKKKEIEYKKLIKIRDEAVSSGDIEKNSEAWVQMTNDINAAELALLQYDTEIIKLNNDIRQLKWDAFDFGQQRLDRITSETETLIDLLDSLPLYDENGKFTNRGRATEALYGTQYDVAAKKAEEYRKAIKDLEATMDPYDQKAIERLDAMKDGLWEQTKAMEAAKDATKDLIANGIQKHIESLNKLIDKYKTSLSDAKSLYDYQKNIASQVKNISSIEKQLASYAGDESEESRANIQKLTEQLEEARTGLKETEWDKYISETNDMLDKMTNEYQEYMNKWLEDINAVFKWAVGDVNSHVDEISKTLKSVAGNDGVSLSSQLKSMLQTSTENNTALITAYNKGNAELSSTVEKGLDKILANAKDITNGEQSGNKKTTTKTTSSNSKSSSQQTDNKKKNEYNNQKSQLDNEYKQQVSNINAQITQLEKEEKQKIAALNKDIKNAKTKAEKTDLEKEVSRISEQYDKELVALMQRKESLTQAYDSYLASLRKKYGYASGSHGITNNQLAWTQENGSELIFRKADGAILTPLNRGDMVFTHDMSQALWDIAKNPNIFKQTVNVPNVGARTINNDNNLTVVLPNVMNYEQFKSAMMSDPKVKNFVQATTIGQALGKGKLNRGNL